MFINQWTKYYKNQFHSNNLKHNLDTFDLFQYFHCSFSDVENVSDKLVLGQSSSPKFQWKKQVDVTNIWTMAFFQNVEKQIGLLGTKCTLIDTEKIKNVYITERK